jgi:hypothetical protein
MKSTLTALLLADASEVEKYSEDQPRDEQGRWGEGSGGSGSATNASDKLTSLGFKRTKVEYFDAKSGRIKVTYEHPSGHKIVIGGGYFKHFKNGVSTGGGTVDTGQVLSHLRDEGFKPSK